MRVSKHFVSSDLSANMRACTDVIRRTRAQRTFSPSIVTKCFTPVANGRMVAGTSESMLEYTNNIRLHGVRINLKIQMQFGPLQITNMYVDKRKAC